MGASRLPSGFHPQFRARMRGAYRPFFDALYAGAPG